MNLQVFNFESNPSSAIARLDEDERKLLDPKYYLGSVSTKTLV